MQYSDRALNMHHRLYRKDAWLRELYNAVGAELDHVDGEIGGVHDQLFSDTATWMLPIYAEELLIDTREKEIDDIRSAIEAAWKVSFKLDINGIQAAANSWRYGIVEVSFVGGRLIVDFVGEYGIPKDLDGFKKAVRKASPAHLGLEFIFRFLTWDEFDAYNKTWDEWDALGLTWDEFETHKE